MVKTSFRDLLTDALAADNAYQAVAHTPHKLSIKGFIRAACDVSHLSEKELEALHKKIDGYTPPLLGVQSFLNRAAKWISEGTVRSMPKDIRRIRHLAQRDLDLEIAALGVDLFKLFAVAVKVATERWPSSFGELESWEDHEQNIRDLERKRNEAFKELETEYDILDLIFGDPEKNGYALVTFKVTSGEVHIGPNCAERLVAWARNTAKKW